MSSLRSVIACLLVLRLGMSAQAQQGFERFFEGPPRESMTRWLMERVDEACARWEGEFERLDSVEAIERRQRAARAFFLDALGPFPERYELRPRVTGTLERKGFRIEKVLFESRPRHFVSALCFVPDPERFAPPHPGVLVPCGHSRNGKAHDTYQLMGASLASHGMVALVFDPLEQGERAQVLEGHGGEGVWGTSAHNFLAAPATLLGWCAASFFVWDGLRALDYLAARPDVDAARIGCTGNSGGGTQTAYLMALDERIRAAAPSCYVTSFERLLHTIGPQDAEQLLPGQLAFPLEHADYLTMRAPTPILICAATKDFFDIQGTWTSFRHAKRVYTHLGFPERIDLMENFVGHNYDRTQRTACLRFLARWLQGRDEPLDEPDLVPIPEADLLCAPGGQVMNVDGARSVYDVLAEEANAMREARETRWATAAPTERRAIVRRLTGIRSLEDMGTTYGVLLGEHDGERDGRRATQGIVLTGGEVPLTGVISRKRNQPIPEDAVPSLWLDDRGAEVCASERVDAWTGTVLALDVRGSGATQAEGARYFQQAWGRDGSDIALAYLLGRSYLAMRTEDILRAALHLRQATQVPRVHLHARGRLVPPALHAAFLEPDLFASVSIEGDVLSWHDVATSVRPVDAMANAVRGALRFYDLSDLWKDIIDRR